MSDVIKREDAIKAISEFVTSMSVCVSVDECHGMKRMQGMAVRALEALPSAERKGKWMRHPNYKDKDFREWDVCSVCGTGCHRRSYEIINGNEFETIYGFSYCPNCGARMVKGEEDE